MFQNRDPGLGAFMTPGSGIRDGKKSASGSGIRDEQPGSYFLVLRNHFFAFSKVKILKFFDEDPGSGMETVRIRDPRWKKVGSGILDKHPGSATLLMSNDKTFIHGSHEAVCLTVQERWCRPWRWSRARSGSGESWSRHTSPHYRLNSCSTGQSWSLHSKSKGKFYNNKKKSGYPKLPRSAFYN